MSDLERLLRSDPSMRRCLKALIGGRDATIDDLRECYSEPTRLSEAIVDSSITDGRIPAEHRSRWLRRLEQNPAFTLDVLSDLSPRRDLADAAWWSREGDRLFQELDAIIDGPEDEPRAFADAEGEELWRQWKEWNR